jgi:DNA polymerase III sliding clamp (beta) subunit (PCNA family)
MGGEYPRYLELFPARESLNTIEIMHVKSAMRFGSHTAVETLVESAEQIERACYVAETKNESAKHGIIELCFEPVIGKSEIEAHVSMSHAHFNYKRNILVNDREYLSERFKIAFNAKYLTQALDHDTTVTMAYSKPLKPVVFTYVGSTVRHLLMPIQGR